MKKPKPIIVKAILGATATSMLISSCLQGHNFEESLYGPFADNPEEGQHLFNIDESNLSDKFLFQLKTKNSIIKTILSSRKEAKLFAKNPDEYISSKEKKFNIEFSQSEKNFLLAFADDEIVKCVSKNDIHAFLALCSQKGYIGLISEDNKPESIREMFKTEEDYKKFLALIDNMQNDSVSTRSGIAVAAVVVYVGAGAFQAAAILSIAWASLVVDEAVSITHSGETRSVDMTIKEPVLKIWTDNNGVISNDAFYEEIIDKQTDLILELIEKEYPYSITNEAKDFIKIQLEGYYGLRK